MAYFDGKPAKVIRNPGEVQVFYGGFLEPDGIGHGHVRATGGSMGENIVYWRLPESEGGREVISNAWDVPFGHGNDLRSHLSDF